MAAKSAAGGVQVLGANSASRATTPLFDGDEVNCDKLHLFFLSYIFCDVCLFSIFSVSAWPLGVRLAVLRSWAPIFGQLRGQLTRCLVAMR